MSLEPRSTTAAPHTRSPRLTGPTDRQPIALAPGTKSGSTVATTIEPLLSIADLARVLNVSRRVVERLRSGGRLPSPDLFVGKIPGGKL